MTAPTRILSAAARNRIVAAQKKRWAEYRQENALRPECLLVRMSGEERASLVRLANRWGCSQAGAVRRAIQEADEADEKSR